MENYSYNSSYPESGGSSPRSREVDFENSAPWEESQSQNNYKVKIMCSYGGKIHPRPHDNQLTYMGGETKILVVDRNVKFGSLLSKLVVLCDSDDISFKYQLPGEDLDALISVTNDDDLEHMMHEYDRLYRVSPKATRLRIFVFPGVISSLNSSARSFGSDEVKSEKERFVEALNSGPVMTGPPPVAATAVSPQGPPPPNSNVDFLFGLEKGVGMAHQPPQPVLTKVQEVDDPVAQGFDERLIAPDPIQQYIQDLQRLRIEEQQGVYRRRNDENLAGGYAGGGDYYKVPEKQFTQSVPGGLPLPTGYWPEKQFTGGIFPASTLNTEQQVYMIPAPSGAYHAPMVRPATGSTGQGYYAVQRMPSEVYRDQQVYNTIPSAAMPTVTLTPQNLPPQAAPKMAGYSEGFGMVRPVSNAGVGMMTEAGYTQFAYDGGVGRQVIYTAQGGVMGAAPPAPPPVQSTQYQAMAAVTAEMRAAGANPEAAGGRIVSKVTQTSV